MGLKVCIVGPGGSGKSQLAFKAIHKYEEEGLFDLVVPVYFSDISSMSFSDFLLNIAKSLFDINDIQIFEKMDVEQQKTVIYNFFSERKNHPLLFLDNYETVSSIINDKNQTNSNHLDEAKKISYFINNNFPKNISILVTSRERNNNLGDKEIRIDLKGLQEQETIKLFSGLTSADYLKNKDNIMADPKAKSALTKIFEKTGGHPLSIEIIAKNTSSIHEIQQMADTLGIGIVNPDEPDKRLQSLEDSFRYTITRLPDDIKNLLYYLTIFKSPFPIDVAKEIFGVDLKNFLNLYDRSLLLEIKSETSFGQIRNSDYWLYSIHPAIRNYLERAIDETIGKTIENLEVEYKYKFYVYYYDMLLDIYKAIGKEDVHRFSMARFNLIYNQDSENNDFDRSIKFAEVNNNLWYCANISRVVGLILQSFGMLSKALEYYFKSLGFNHRLNDKDGLSAIYKDIGVVYWKMGKYEQALEYHNKALEIDTKLNRRVGLALDYKNIGLVYGDIGNLQQSLEYHNKALEIDTELNDRVGLAGDYKNIGNVYGDIGNLQQSLEYHNKALEIDTELNDRVGLAGDYKNIGNVYGDIGNLQQSLEYHNKALEIDTELNDRVGLAGDYGNIGSALFKMGNNKDAQDYYFKSLNICKELNDKVNMALCYWGIARIFREMNKNNYALEYYNKALEINTDLNDRVQIAGNHYNMSFILYDMNKKEEALEHLSTAKTILLDFQKETGYSHPLLKDVEDRISFIDKE